MGAVPPNSAYSKSPKVHPEVSDTSSEDKIQISMMAIQKANAVACDLLIV